jgi:hypothetical protein
LENSEYGFSFGGGIETYVLGNTTIKMEFTSRSMGVFGTTNSMGLGITF